MTVETFFANFGHLANAPNGVQKLRELILQLAVQGKLVPQDERDEPASVLLERIETEKAKLVKEKVIRKTTLTAIAPVDKSYELPSTWEWVRFGSIAQHNAGKTLDKGRNTGQPRDYITTSNLYWGYFDLSNVRQMPIKEEELDKCTARNGDLLIVEGGEAGRAAVWTNDYEVCFQNHVHRARFYCGVDPFYVFRFFEKLNLSGEISQYRKGVGISNMSGKSLASIVLPLPPLEEQKRIVAKVDQLMTLCDGLEARRQKQQQGRVRLNNAALDALLTAREPDEFSDHWQRISTNFDLLYDHPETIAKLRAAILQLAVQGKLVPQDPNDDPASVLLERIKAEKERLVKEKVIKEGKVFSKVEDEEKYVVLPSDWSWARMTDLCTLITDGTHQTPKYTTSGRIFISAKNVKPFKFIPQKHRWVSEEDYQGYIKNRRPEKGDILLTRVGAGIGESAVIDVALEFAIYVSVGLLKPSRGNVDPGYLALWLNSPYGRKHSERNTYGKGVSQGNLNLGLIRNFAVSLPPFDEQKRIVVKVDQLMALCDELEAKIKHVHQHSEKLIEATVRQLLVA